jgi:hypothetical protein
MSLTSTSMSSFELVDSHDELKPVLTALCAKEQATASSARSAEVVRPTPADVTDA